MILAIRNIEKSLGSSEKKPSSSEVVNMAVIRKSIVAKQKIKKGEFLSDKNIIVKRPGTGISPMEWDNLIGTRSRYDFKKDELIEV